MLLAKVISVQGEVINKESTLPAKLEEAIAAFVSVCPGEIKQIIPHIEMGSTAYGSRAMLIILYEGEKPKKGKK